MNIATVYIIIIFVSLLVTLFVLVMNFREAKKSIMDLDFRVISTQLVILLAWILILIQVLKANTLEEAFVNTAVFILAIIIGVLVIQNVIKENQANVLTNRLIESLGVYNRRLRELDKQKTDFIGLASHQLRTPNSIVSGYTSMLLEGDFGKLNKKAKEAIQKIEKSSRNSSAIISELLDTAQIERGAIKYNKVKFDLINILEEVSNEFKEVAKRKGLDFILDFESKLSVYIKGDRYRILQALYNLLDNAIKYTERGHIKITARKIDSKIKIIISDTGIGVKEEDLDDIFDKFIRGDNAKNLDVTGSGLGLFITKEIVEANDGIIWAESAGLGKGTAFKIEFPIIN